MPSFNTLNRTMKYSDMTDLSLDNRKKSKIHEQSITRLVFWEDSEHEVEEAVEHQIYTIGRARNVG